MNLKHLTDSTLLFDIKKLASDERLISLQLLHHLKEIERRRLFSDLGYGSLFDYVVRELGFSEPSASRRIQSARMLKEMPYLEKKIADGSLNMTTLTMAGKLFRDEDIVNPDVKKEILAIIENTTKKECGNELLKFSTQEPAPKERILQVSVDLHSMRLNVTQETLDLFEEIKSVLAHRRLNNDQLMQKIFKIALPVLNNNKFKTNAKFTTLAASPRIGRYVSAIVKKQVYQRDQGKCTKCKSSYKLEYDHIRPFAQGGESTLSNLRLLCFSCNQRRLI
jgi:hypothetical protein